MEAILRAKGLGIAILIVMLVLILLILWIISLPGNEPGGQAGKIVSVSSQVYHGKFGAVRRVLDQASSTSSSWTGTKSSNTDCNRQLHPYCFEQ